MAGVSPELKAIFWDALDYPPGTGWRDYLDRACGGDPNLRARVEALLGAHADAGRFLEGPVATPTATWEGPGPPEAQGRSAGPYKLLEWIGRVAWASSAWPSRPIPSAGKWR
jgi:hypothetical protein